jgi:tetratricopeptide (TPR) repeat protein
MDERMSAFEHYEHGLVLKQVQMFEAALQDFRQAAAHQQYAGRAQVQIALCLKAMGRYEEAVTAFYRGLESPISSSIERLHVLYLLAQTLELTGRYLEPLKVYGWIRLEDPKFLDVESRIKHLISGNSGSDFPQPHGISTWSQKLSTLVRHLRPQILSWLGHVRDWLGQHSKTLEAALCRHSPYNSRDAAGTMLQREHKLRRSSAPWDRKIDKRRHVRVAVHLASRFSSKGPIMAGEGELRDLSPGGCRISSPITVPIGAELECCIFPQKTGNPFTVEAATVRWSHAWEFGLAFTKVQPDVQQQIMQLCSTPVSR